MEASAGARLKKVDAGQRRVLVQRMNTYHLIALIVTWAYEKRVFVFAIVYFVQMFGQFFVLLFWVVAACIPFCSAHSSPFRDCKQVVDRFRMRFSSY